MESHVKNCVKREEKSVPAQNGSDDIQNERLMAIEENLTFLRKSLNEEIRMRYEMIGELGHLKKRNQVCFVFFFLLKISIIQLESCLKR